MDGAAALEAFAHDLAGVVDAVRARLGAFPAG
jgi:hypothetical protein